MCECYLKTDKDQTQYVYTDVTFKWKLEFTALSDRFDSDSPTCSKTFIFSWIIGLDQHINELW